MSRNPAAVAHTIRLRILTPFPIDERSVIRERSPARRAFSVAGPSTLSPAHAVSPIPAVIADLADPDAATAAWARFDASLDVADRGRIRGTVGGELDGDTRALARDARWRAALDHLPAPQRDALERVEAGWPGDISARSFTFIQRRLAPWGVARVVGSAVEVHPEALVAAAALHLPDSDAAWAHATCGDLATAAALWVGLRRASPAELLPLLTLDRPPRAAHVAALMARPLPLAEAERARSALAAAFRDAVMRRIEGGEGDALPAWIVDAPGRPGEPPWRRCAMPLLFCDDAFLLQRALPLAPARARRDELVTRLALVWWQGESLAATLATLEAPDGSHDRDILADVDVMRATDPGGDPGRSASALRARVLDLVATGPPPPPSDLVERLARDDRPVAWSDLLALLRLPQVESHVARLLRARDWDRFDAPGEGQLPRLWAAILLMGARWNLVRDAFVAAGHGELVDEVEDDPESLLLAFPSPAAAGAPTDDAATSGLRDPDPQGLVEGIAEAYGDVWSPHDPFSTRARPATSGAAPPADGSETT